jgi:hypothetical protein
MIAEMRPIADADAKRCGFILLNGRRRCKVIRVTPRNDRENLPLRDTQLSNDVVHKPHNTNNTQTDLIE